MPFLRPFKAGDMKKLIDVWNESLVADPINAQRFMSNIVGDPAMESRGLPVIVDEQGTIIAFAYATVSYPKSRLGERNQGAVGWLNAIGIRSDKRRMGYGLQCMKAVRDYLASYDCQSLNVAAFAPKYIMPGVDVDAYPVAPKFFKKAGFEAGSQVVSMQADLQRFQVPREIAERETEARSDGIIIETMSEEFLVSLLEFIHHDLGSGADRVIRQALGYGRNIRQIFVARDANDVIGYCMYGIYDGNPERFGPFGVRPDQRGRHLGKILLYRCMQAMREDGLLTVWFKSTIEGSPAWHLYRRAGFRNIRRFSTFVQKLPPQVTGINGKSTFLVG